MSYEITIQTAGVTYQASSEDTVLNSALASQLFLEHSCRKGSCGLCAATLLSGSVKNELNEVIQAGKILTCSSYPCSDLSIKANFFTELTDIKCQTFPCKVLSYELINDIVILKLRYPPTQAFHYLAGQYIDLIYKGVRRSYSIANAKLDSTHIELHIRLIADGEFSALLAAGCEVGQLMRIEGPKGSFFIRKSERPLIFLAGGTGFAPVKAMIEDLLANHTNRTIYLYWGMTNSNSFYTDSAQLWSEQYAQVHYIPVVSGEDPIWTGRRGLLSNAVIEDAHDLSEYHVYACGSPLMINNAKETFLSYGLNEEHFYADLFVSSK